MGSIPSGISGSRAAAVLGISGFDTRLAAWQRIIEEAEPGWNTARGFLLPEREETAAMRWGTAFEDAVAKLAGKALGGRVTKREKEYRDEITPSGAPLTCHIDGVIKGRLYEAKTASSFSFNSSWGRDRIPGYYQAQVQHNLFLTGLAEAVVVCLEFPETPEKWEAMGWYTARAGDKWLLQNDGAQTGATPETWARALAEMGFFHRYEIAADQATQTAMLDGYAKFWESVKAGKPPAPENYADIKRLFPEPKGTLIAPPAIEMKLREYRDIAAELGGSGPQAKRQEQLKVEILSWARGQAAEEDDESAEKLVIRNEAGEKCGSFGKTKTGALVFRA
ncbi:MAG: YqaJ viral recombinase family protein [Treponema sp.]|jgi:hypothetical protein|nr:YqaJ viral recombinase family protein [Treponema sp.]